MFINIHDYMAISIYVKLIYSYAYICSKSSSVLLTVTFLDSML